MLSKHNLATTLQIRAYLHYLSLYCKVYVILLAKYSDSVFFPLKQALFPELSVATQRPLKIHQRLISVFIILLYYFYGPVYCACLPRFIELIN